MALRQPVLASVTTLADSEAPPSNVWLVGQRVSPSQRRDRYVPESFRHPAKMLPELARRIIEHYSPEGGLVLDPMSGIGTTGVEALWLNREYVGIEIEPDYEDLQRANLRLAVDSGAPNSEWQVFQQDARAASPVSNADLVAFSPPYQDAVHSQGDELGRIRRKIASGRASPELIRRFGKWDSDREQALAGTRSAGYSRNSTNVGHFKGQRYWVAMREVYRRSYEALRPGGYLVVVTKDQRDRKTGELTNLYGGTVDVCRDEGFELHQHIVALLCRIDPESGTVTPRTSHWQRLAVQKTAQEVGGVLLGQFEDVAVFRKPLLASG
jgi:modification methylase